ncbi:hypothetical protein SAMN05421813_11027 [Daejeonella rubra]|uniref:DUF2202 domain-containing protein n=1 Tax=Daejeonella rubra TaxID=990371 RepID=A0A1G9SF09_9SPHI|nr:DUF2202 domain-containing protein [Daejeonella rubra]SDM34029.1 hypothetical protein SAMN05421813_11027 [Daejeonella rubra]
MKNQLKNTGLGLILTAIIIAFGSCTKDKNTVNNDNNTGNLNKIDIQSQINTLPKESLSVDELKSLSFLREEEKLAMDVYTTLFNKWGVNIFNNISKSESTHMLAVLNLLNKYNLEDPVGANETGEFENIQLKALYDQLVSEGNTSTLNAYKVGATIEDLDLYDINKALVYIDNQDIRYVYEMLAKGSRNHLRSFYKNIINAGGTYTPQYISNEEFKTIINSEMETGN